MKNKITLEFDGVKYCGSLDSYSLRFLGKMYDSPCYRIELLEIWNRAFLKEKHYGKRLDTDKMKMFRFISKYEKARVRYKALQQIRKHLTYRDWMLLNSSNLYYGK